MPNPRAQKNPTFIPQALQGLADMGRGAVRGALAEGLGTAGDITQALSNIKTAGFMPAMLARGLQGPTSEEMSHALRGMTPNPLTQPDRAHTAQMGQTFGSVPVGAAAGTAGTNLANRMKQFQRTQAMMPRRPRSVEETLQPRLFTNTTETLAGYAGKAINDAMLGDTSGALSKALSGVAPRKLFIGPGSQAWDEQAAFQASKMEAAKASPQEIWAKTGTFRGPDGHWRQEISDKGSVLGLSQTKGSADEILKHPELYAAYPELAGTKMNLYGTMKGAPEIKASLSGTPKEGFQVDIYEPGIKDGPRLSAIHEMQHAIQDIEGFSPGGNRSQAFLHPSFQEIKQDTLKTLRPAGGPIDPVLLNNLAADSYYYRLGGEAEARAAARRANMDEAERKATFPLESYDMLPDRIINIAPYANGGMVSGRHNDDGTGAMGTSAWMADNVSSGLAQGMAAGGTPYKGINPMATGLGKMLEQSKVRKTSSDQMARSREAKFANQEALRLQRQKQLAAAKTARLNALAPKLSTYVPPASGTTVGGTNTGVTTTPPPGSSAVVDPGTNTAIKTVQPSAEPKVQASAVPSSVADIAQNLSQANQTVASMTPEEYAQAGLQSEQLRKERFLRNVDALKEAFPNDWWNRDIASYYGGKDTNWLNETMKGINAQGVIAKNAYENPAPLSDADWYSKTGTSNIYRDPKSGYGISVDDGKLNYYNPQGNRLSRSILSAEDLYKNASQYGIDLSGIGSLGQKLDAAGIRYKPGELYAGTGSNLGVNFADVAAGKLGSAYDWTQDPFASQKGSSDRLAESQALAQKLGIDLTKSENLATLSPQLAGDVTRQFVVSTPSISGSPTYSWYDTQQAADQAAQQYGGTVTNLAGKTVTPPKGARGGLVSMADGGIVRMSKGGKFGAPIEAAAKTFKALPGQSFQGKTGLSVLSPDEEARRLIAKMDQPTLEDTLAKISKQSNLEEVLKQKKAPAVKKVKPETEASVPFSIPRAAPKTDTEIRDIAERVARQQLGEHVRGKTSSNLAGRSMAEVERLKQLEYELTPNKQLPPVQVVEPMYGDINVAIPGDQSISDTILTSVRGEPIGALQQGGSRYGLGQLDRPLYAQAAWKSNIAASRGLQNRVDRLAKYYEKMSESQKFDYDPTRILGTYFGMGTDAMNYAQHFTDANLRAIQNRIKSGLMSDADIQQFNEIIRKGNPSVEGKKGGPFPDFPGIENMEDSYIAMTNDPNMRKWFNNRMKTPAITQKLNMPDGKEIEWAISEEELRNLEPFTTGHSIVQLRPGEQIALDPGHVTYTHRIPGKMLGRQQELSPIEVSHPDTIEFLRKNYRPSEVITTAQKIFPVQRVDQQYMDEMGKYQQYLRDIRGFKKGGKIKKMQAGGKAIVSGLQALAKPAKQTITSAIDPTMDIASRLSQPDRVNLLPMPSRWFLDPKNNPNVQKLVEKVLEVNNMKRSDFYSGAFVNPRTGEVMDKKVMQDVGVLINPNTGRPMMSAEKETDLTIGDRKKGSITKSNLVRKQLYETEGDPILKDLDFLVAIEQSGMGHKYGLATEYATPAEMFNTMTGNNPTLRPKSQGDVFGIGDIVGRMSMKSSKMPHDVYESLLIAPKGSDVQGVKLSKKKGGTVRRRK